MNLPVQTTILDPEFAYLHRTLLRIPTIEDVRRAAEFLPSVPSSPLSRFGHRETKQSVRAYESPKWRLNIAPGLVSIDRKFCAPKEHFGHTDGVIEDNDAPTRGRVTEWSERSRLRMTQTLDSLDYGPMFEPGLPAAMVTLTLPGDGWEQLVPDIPTFKKMVDRLNVAHRPAWGQPLRGTWKMEFQKRGAPHLHILMVPPAGLSRGRGALKGKKYSNWLSLRWAQIVGAPEGSRMRKDHELAGVEVNFATVARYSDPRRIGAYFAKHGSFSAKDYQNEMPQHWQEAIRAGETGGGNFWGYWGLEKAVVTVELRGSMKRASFIDGEPLLHRHQQPKFDLDGSVYGNNRHYVSR